jgi:hypothetical protein
VSLTITLSATLADELVAAGVCGRPLGRRGGAEAAAVAVTVVGVAGNLSSVIVALPMLRAFARRLIAGVAADRSPDASATIALRVTRADGTTVEIAVAGPSVDDATNALVEALAAAQGPFTAA